MLFSDHLRKFATRGEAEAEGARQQAADPALTYFAAAEAGAYIVGYRDGSGTLGYLRRDLRRLHVARG